MSLLRLLAAETEGVRVVIIFRQAGILEVTCIEGVWYDGRQSKFRVSAD